MTDAGTGTGLESGGTVCGLQKLVGKFKTPQVLLVLDRSRTMQSEWDGGDAEAETRWASVWNAVDTTLERQLGRMHFAIEMFPSDLASDEKNACYLDQGVDIPFGTTNKTEILGKMPGKRAQLQGRRPTVEALSTALEYMRQVQLDDALGLPQAVVLVTGGRASCDPSMSELLELISAANKDSIPLYVVGVGIDAQSDEGDFSAELNALAVAGGTQTHFAASNAGELEHAMATIMAEVTDCRFALHTPPTHPHIAWMEIEDAEVPYGPGVYSCAELLGAGYESGWVYTSDVHLEIEACGKACGAFADAGSATMKFPCPPNHR